MRLPISKILPTATLAMLVLTNPDEAEAVHLPKGSKFFHGSAKAFKEFDDAFLGAGEGAQAFSTGHYATQNTGLSVGYARTAARNAAERENLIPSDYRYNRSGSHHPLPNITPVMPRGYAHTSTNLPGVRAAEKPAFLRKKILDIMEEVAIMRKAYEEKDIEQLVDKRLGALMEEAKNRPAADRYYEKMAKRIGEPKKDYSVAPIPERLASLGAGTVSLAALAGKEDQK